MIDLVISDAELASVDKPELLALVQSLRDELAFKQKVIDKITHEMAVLKRLKFAATSEHFSPEQRSLLEEAIDYSRGRWPALARYLDDGDLPCDNNWVEDQIRPIALGRSNWLFAGSLRAGKRAAAIMSLVHSARINGHDPYVYLKDVMERLPTQPASRVAELLPHRWKVRSAV